MIHMACGDSKSCGFIFSFVTRLGKFWRACEFDLLFILLLCRARSYDICLMVGSKLSVIPLCGCRKVLLEMLTLSLGSHKEPTFFAFLTFNKELPDCTNGNFAFIRRV